MASKDMKSPDNDAHDAAEIADVVQKCVTGDRDAQRQLYELRNALVYRLTVRMVGPEEAQDLVQQVFMQLFRKIGQFAGHSSFDTWLYRLATNEALQYLRKRKRWNFETLAVDPASPHESRIGANENSELLQSALGRLEPDLRAIFVLKELERLSYRDIAASVGIPEGTVGSRLNRARRELKLHLADLGWEA